FNADYSVNFSEQEQQREGGIDYNYRRERAWTLKCSPTPVDQFATSCGTDAATYVRERPGVSAFVLDEGAGCHSYSGYGRGLVALRGMYEWLDRAPLGSNEQGFWWKLHDEYAR